MAPGEAHHHKGIQGVQRAKRWLDYSTRVRHSYTNTSRMAGNWLTFEWPYGGESFSFDLGGELRGGEVQDASFMAEVKNYQNEGDLPQEYRDFVGQCYVAYAARPNQCDNLIWISWAPFQARSWDKHRSPPTLRKHLLHVANRQRLFNTGDADKAAELLDVDVVSEVARRLWLVTLCDEQENLQMMQEHYRRFKAIVLDDEAEGG